MKRYEGKICLITASTAGIGLAIAMRMAVEGGHVIICSRKQQNVTDAVALIEKAGGKVDGIVCDVGDAKDRSKLVEHVKAKYGKLDVLVPNAAISTHFG
jgi:dehydrogenase/reductase SDR family member 4